MNQEINLVEEALYMDAYIVEEWIYYLPDMETIFLNYDLCNCTLGLPSITCTYEYKSNIE